MFTNKRPRAFSPLWRIAAGTAICLAVLALDTGTAAAESCLDQVQQIANRYDVSTDPPTVAPGGTRGVTPRDLSRSGGVVEPPDVQDKSVIAPPPGQRYAMPTVPDVAPKKPLPAADRTTLQAILVAARAQAERGNDPGCREALAKAAEVLERKD